MSKEPLSNHHARAKSGKRPPSGKTSFLQASLLILISMIFLFCFLEGGLTLLGVTPVLDREDPFVGFAGNIPLFEESKAPNGNKILSTAKNKLTHFNQQMFVEKKASDTYRIFCLGGSTTYGRPYNDQTSFAGWLRELLPEAQKAIDWEVINVGGISYASYRVARLMEDLGQYRPDLFIIYTGQNEFLEERTYRDLRKVPEGVRAAVGLLAKTRTWAAMQILLDKIGVVQNQQKPEKTRLSAEVNTILDHSTGPKDYQRDDELQNDVLEHYRISLNRMADIAEQAGAKVILVTPASNLKDTSPFKSQHSAGLQRAEQKQLENLLDAAMLSSSGDDLPAALQALDRAIALDPRYAVLHYRRGKVLFKMGRLDDAKIAFERARDEDVCPLRALSPMRDIVLEVSRQRSLPVIDYVGLVERQVFIEKGHTIPGEESFLDHVHPTIDRHRLLATALMDEMINLDILHPSTDWDRKASLARVSARIESRLNPHMQAMALINLAKVLHWAGKFDESKRLALRGLEAAKGDSQLTALASNVLIKLAKLQGNREETDHYIQEALAADPWNPRIHYQLGMRLISENLAQKGASHVLFARAFWDTNQTNSVLGLILYQQGRYQLAYPYLKRALQQSPNDKISLEAREALRRTLGSPAERLVLPEIVVRRYPSGTPRTIYLKDPGSTNQDQPDGFLTEWYEDGSLKRYVDYVGGILHGGEVQWDKDGQVLSRSKYAKGVRSDS